MAYSGVINWGPVVAHILIHDVVKINDHINSAVVDIIINGQTKVLRYEPDLD